MAERDPSDEEEEDVEMTEEEYEILRRFMQDMNKAKTQEEATSLSRQEYCELLGRLDLSPCRFDLVNWAKLRFAAALSLNAAVEGAELCRPIPPFADAMDAMLGSAGVEALAVTDGDGNCLKCMTLDGTVRKVFDTELQRPCELCRVIVNERSALAISSKHKNKIVIVNAFDWGDVKHVISVQGKWPDGMVALGNGTHFTTVCDQSHTVHTFNADTAVELCRQPWKYDFVSGATSLHGKVPRVALGGEGRPITVINPFTLNEKHNTEEEWPDVMGGDGKILLHSSGYLMIPREGALCMADVNTRKDVAPIVLEPAATGFLNDIVELAPQVLAMVFGKYGICIYRLEAPYCPTIGHENKAHLITTLVGDKWTGRLGYCIGACKVTYRPVNWPILEDLEKELGEYPPHKPELNGAAQP